MGCDFHWLMCAFNEHEFELAQRKLAHSLQAEPITPEQEQAISLYQKDPLQILPTFIPADQLPVEKQQTPMYQNGYIEADSFYHFLNAFCLANIGDQVTQLPLNEQNVLSFERYDHQPFALLVFSLGLGFKQALPGLYGNMFIEYENLPNAISRTQQVLTEINEGSLDLMRRAFSVCSAGKPNFHYEQEIQTLLHGLPKQMDKAYQQKKHFSAFTFWMG